MQKSQPYHAMLTPQILCAFNGALTHSMMIICALQQIDELANIGRQGEKGETGEPFTNCNGSKEQMFLIHLLSELLTRLKDAIFADNWEIQVFQVVGWLVSSKF